MRITIPASGRQPVEAAQRRYKVNLKQYSRPRTSSEAFDGYGLRVSWNSGKPELKDSATSMHLVSYCQDSVSVQTYGH